MSNPQCSMPGPFQVEVAPVERVLSWTPQFIAADFECPPDHPRFRGSGPLLAPCIAFPRTHALFRVEGRGALIVDPSVLVFLPQGSCYERSAVLGQPDKAEVLGVAPALFARLGETLGCDLAALPAQTLPLSAAHLLRARRCFAALRRGELEAEDAEDWLFDLLVSSLGERAGRREARPSADSRMRRFLVERARLAALRRPQGASPLTRVAAELGVSPAHLCRLSRAELGIPFGQYVMELRLRRALELMRDPALGLLDVAIECGFSSHAHFTRSFAARFGEPPSQVRLALQARPHAGQQRGADQTPSAGVGARPVVRRPASSRCPNSPGEAPSAR